MSCYVLGNWKSNGDRDMVAAFRKFFAEWQPETPADFYRGLALPYHLLGSDSAFEGALLGAQQVSRYPEGAYTGEITNNMLKASTCSFCLVGHSERRQYFGETVDDTAARMERLLTAGLLPVLCIGETLEQRQAGSLEQVLREQLAPVNSLASDVTLVVAYEPVWAIGTGVAAQPADVVDAHQRIKGMLAESGFGDTPVLYGGSVKAANAAQLASIEDVDGFLVGGASLKPEDFRGILEGFIQTKY